MKKKYMSVQLFYWNFHIYSWINESIYIWK